MIMQPKSQNNTAKVIPISKAWKNRDEWVELEVAARFLNKNHRTLRNKVSDGTIPPHLVIRPMHSATILLHVTVLGFKANNSAA
jgi:hypothetical protein